MPIATNDQGQALRLDESGKWVPTKLATNPQTGERLALDGSTWTPLPGTKPGAIEDAARSLPGGIARGVAGIMGLPGDAEQALNHAQTYLGNKVVGALGGTPIPDNAPQTPSILPASAGINAKLSAPTGGYYEPKTTAGRYAQAIAEFAPFITGGEASLPARILTRAVAPVVGSEAAGEYVAGKGAGAGTETAARFAGALAGGLPAVARTAGGLVSKSLANTLSQSIAPEDAALVAKYEQMGGHLRPGQYSPSNFMRQGDAVMADSPWPRAAGFAADSPHAILPSQQADEFNGMLAKTFGEDAPRITDDVIQRATSRIGKVYEDVLPRNNVAIDDGLRDAFTKVESNVADAAPAMEPKDADRMSATMNRIFGQLTDQGGITGKQYQVYRQRGGILDELAGSTSPVLQKSATDIRNALDDAFARQAQGDDAAALAQAKQQYRNLAVLKPLAAKAPTGNISPGLVMGAVNKEFGSPAAAGDLGTLARVGTAFLKAQPSSGTAERNVWRSLINKPFSEGVPNALNSAISLPVNAVVTRQLNKVVNSPEMRAKLLAQVLSNPGATTGQAGGATAAQLAQLLQNGAP